MPFQSRNQIIATNGQAGPGTFSRNSGAQLRATGAPLPDPSMPGLPASAASLAMVMEELKAYVTLATAQAITGLKTFSRGAAAPFAVDAASLLVANLNADKLDSRDETAFALLAGRAAGQLLSGGTASAETLTLQSTAHATKGKLLFGTSAYDEVNNRLGLNTATPLTRFQVKTGADQNAAVRPGTDFGGSYTGVALDSIDDSGGTRKMLVVAGDPVVVYGNCGMGEPVPGEALDIAGNLRVRHLRGKTAAPTVAITAAGAGANALATLAGTDLAGVITLTTSVLDTPAADSDILTVTFNAAYSAAPVVLMTPSNDNAWSLAYGVVRCRQDDATTTVFKLRSGGTPLPAVTAAVYIFKYLIAQ